jgi:prepilin-type processing-associated H-X9-DG protein
VPNVPYYKGETIAQLEHGRTGSRSGLTWVPVAGDFTTSGTPVATSTSDDTSTGPKILSNDGNQVYVYDQPMGGPHGNPKLPSSINVLYADGHVQ